MELPSATVWPAAASPTRPDEERVFALHQLQAAGGLPEAGGMTMWLDGAVREVQPLTLEIDDEPFGYAEAALDHYEAAQAAHRADRLDAAVAEYEAALALEPRCKEAHHNLAVIYAGRGNQEAAHRHLDQALAIDSAYAFPLCARALQAASAGDMEGARRWLKPLSERRRWRLLELQQYLMTMVRLAVDEKQFDEARKHLAILQELAPHDPHVAELELVVRVASLGDDANAWFRESDERFRQRRQKKSLPADPTLADCLRHLSGDDMTAIAEVLGLGPVYKYKANERRAFLAQALLDPDTIRRAIGELNDAERSALADLLAAGGSIPRADFVRTYGDDSEERPYMLYHAKLYKSVLGRLRARGLIYEGAIDAVQVVVVPRELRSTNIIVRI